MSIMRLPTIGWGAFMLLGALATTGGAVVQLCFAALGIGALGLAHGASDLEIVPPDRRATFLFVYGGTIIICLGWWVASPMMALTLFLLLSAIHFGLDDAPTDRPIERLARGVIMVAGPAILHRASLASILALAGGASATGLVAVMQVAGLLALAAIPILVLARWRSGERATAIWLAVGSMMLVLLPPLVGFTLVFVLLHARAQTAKRMKELGCPDLWTYLKLVGPLLAGAAIVTGTVALIFNSGDTAGMRALFAAITALAVPHMLVTPIFRRSAAQLAGAR